MRQRGAALMLILLVLSTGLALALMSMQGQSHSRYQAYHAAQTSRALSQARLALIAWSLSHKSTIYNNGRPGELPCPDLHPPESEDAGWSGSADSADCDTPARRLGRLPWKTLGLPQQIDGAGESLWYTVAAPFHDSDTSALNAHTPIPAPFHAYANLGTTAYPEAVAVIFAPGGMLDGQTRTTPAETQEAHNYLDRYANFDNAGITAETRKLNGPVSDATAHQLNDQLVVITADELLRKIMQRVLIEYPQALRHKYPAPPYPSALEGGCNGTPPPIEEEGSDTNWLTRNQWEILLDYQCIDMVVQAK